MKTKNEKQKFDLTWNVFRYDINKKQIYKFNVFNHGRFYDEVCDLLNKKMPKEDFSEHIRCATMYYYWSKAEHEIVITSFPPYVDRKEIDRLITENPKYRDFVNLDCGSKIDIYEQLRMNWDHFINYLWGYKTRSLDYNGLSM